jgi:DNA-binding NarL/FixJ family response regulator
MSERPIRILLVDDHPLMLKGLRAALEPEPDMAVVGSAATGADALLRFRETKPDVTIMDITLGHGMDGIEATRAIRREFPEARIIVVTVHDDEFRVCRALKAGVVTYLLKEKLGDNLAGTVRQVHAGDGPIPPDVARKLADHVAQAMPTERELEVLRLAAQGLRNKQISAHLRISEQTVLTHFKNIFAKLKVSDRTLAVMVALKRGLIDQD